MLQEGVCRFLVGLARVLAGSYRYIYIERERDFTVLHGQIRFWGGFAAAKLRDPEL